MRTTEVESREVENTNDIVYILLLLTPESEKLKKMEKTIAEVDVEKVGGRCFR